MDIKEKTKRLKRIIKNVYGDSVAVRCGQSKDIIFDLKEKSESVDYAIYVNEDNETALIWNIKLRRENGATAHVLTYPNYEPQDEKDGYIRYKQACFKAADGKKYREKIMSLSIDTLNEVLEYIEEYFGFEQNEIQSEGLAECNLLSRGRHTTTAWNRYNKFRIDVLRVYDGKCAVCRCSESAILQAAHINPVSQNGSDTVKNGICLCANHHIMFDRGIIEIDTKALKLKSVKESVKKMAWYQEFVDKYNGELIRPDYSA